MDRYVPPGGEPIDLAYEYYSTALRRWRHPGDHPAFEGHITYGRLADGRWYVRSTIREANGEWVFGRQRDAEETIVEVQMLRGDGRWTEVGATPYDPPPGQSGLQV